MTILDRPKKRVRISCEEPTIHQYSNDEVAAEAEEEESDIEDLRKIFDSPPLVDQLEIQCQRPGQRGAWLSRSDLANFRASAKKLCRSLNLDNVLQEAYQWACRPDPQGDSETARMIPLLESLDYSKQRGLERWSSTQHAFLRSIKIIEVKTAVLLEQSSQFLSGKKDPEKLAKVAQDASITSQRFAQILASADATIALQLQQTTCLPAAVAARPNHEHTSIQRI